MHRDTFGEKMQPHSPSVMGNLAYAQNTSTTSTRQTPCLSRTMSIPSQFITKKCFVFVRTSCQDEIQHIGDVFVLKDERVYLHFFFEKSFGSPSRFPKSVFAQESTLKRVKSRVYA